jgi:hypothetical protein
VEWGSLGMILKEGKFGGVRRENGSGKSNRQHLGDEVTEEQKFRSVEDGKLTGRRYKVQQKFSRKKATST